MNHRMELEAAEQKKLDAGASAQIMEANNRYFQRECEREGIDPALRVSPELLKLSGGQ